MRNNELRFAVQTRQTFAHDMLGSLDGSQHLPWITSLAVDPVSRQVTWTSESAAQLDASALRLEVTEGRYLIWRIVAPNGLPTTFKIPALPAEFAMYDLQPTDIVHGHLMNVDYEGVTADQFMTKDLDQVGGFIDTTRRGATAHTAR